MEYEQRNQRDLPTEMLLEKSGLILEQAVALYEESQKLLVGGIVILPLALFVLGFLIGKLL